MINFLKIFLNKIYEKVLLSEVDVKVKLPRKMETFFISATFPATNNRYKFLAKLKDIYSDSTTLLRTF